MHTKLTLRIDEPLIKAAKKYAKAHDKSLSQLIANYLLLITKVQYASENSDPMPPLTRSLKGILRGKKISEADYKKHIEDKYK
ncbi:MAG TPA: DUF6364 family protein [Gammaproteobacteria bacterium]|nr:DUF6364 family protein [Gammaproteobacteria bacterium]